MVVMSEIDSLGRQLSVELDCPIRYAWESSPSYFVCGCGKRFLLEVVRKRDWASMKERHEGVRI